MRQFSVSRSSQARRQGVRVVVAAAFCVLAFACWAEMFSVPSWLPEGQRFEVNGASNEIAQVERTLAAMRDAFHPKLIEMMRRGDSATNGYPSAMGPTLAWIVHVSLPGVATNETVYFESYKKPLSPSAFDFNLLTNRAARLSCVPFRTKLSLVYDDGKKDSVSRAIPGVDYPGVSYEDEGSTEDRIILRLCAPKAHRRLKVRAEPKDVYVGGWECKWAEAHGNYWRLMPPRRTENRSDSRVFWAYRRAVTDKNPKMVFAFSRMGNGFWGPPSKVVIVPGKFGVWAYGSAKQVASIDYGAFKDVYRYGEKDQLLGFTRYLPNMCRDGEYSNLGEKIIDGYADDRPKTTRKVKYAVVDGRLQYAECDENIHHRNEPPEDRASKW